MNAERGARRGRGVTRRQALLLAGAGAVSAGVGATGLLQGWGEHTDPTANGTDSASSSAGDLPEPEVISSKDGQLQLTLTAAASRVDLGGRSVQALAYNGSIPGPTLRLRPGDRVVLDLVNRLDAGTNLHTHGLHISPVGNSDNIFLHIDAGQTFRYEYQIPPDHPAGTFWYHPHLHQTLADQLFAGMAGAIIIDRDDSVPLQAERERLLVVTDTTLDGDRIAQVTMRDRMLGREGELVLVNGRLEPTVTLAPGSREHWRIVNACCSRFLRLRFDGVELLQVATDAGRLGKPSPIEEVFLAPGNRTELLVRATGAGPHRLVAEPVDRGRPGRGMGGPAGASRGPVTLLHLVTSGDAVQAPPPPERLVHLDDLRDAKVDTRRTVTFAMGPGGGMGAGMAFTIDGKEFDPNRVDTRVRLNTIEEWTIVNTSPMDHPFHLHVWFQQVVARNGTPVGGSPLWLDTVNIPARANVTVRLRLTDFPGRSVYHCHILDHEDLGMMGIVEATG